jgi:hypothetical protein
MLSASYPYPELVPQLQFRCTPAVYQQVVAEYIISRSGRFVLPCSEVLQTTKYWQLLPQYTFARCPICGNCYTHSADTYSLRGWNASNDRLLALYRYVPYQPLCAHFLGIHEFMNLHDQEPSELGYLANSAGEVPRLTPWFLPEDIPSFAVLHALPICRIEAEQFVPAYTVFILTYFSENPGLLLERHYQTEAERGRGDPEYYPGFFSLPGLTRNYDEKLSAPYYELDQRADRGQLGWLDYTRADLPLCLGTGKRLPGIYRHVEGRRYMYTWRDGRFQ